MLRKNKLVCLLLLCFLCDNHAQDNLHIHIENIIEETYAGEEADDIESLYEELKYFLQHPLNINFADNDELKKLVILNDFQIQNLHAYIKQYGPLQSADEMQYIYGFSPEIIHALKPFIYFSDKDHHRKLHFASLIKDADHELVLRESLRKKQTSITPDDYGFHKNIKSLLKYRMVAGDVFSAGLTAENDYGEQFFAPHIPYGYDFYSGYLRAEKIGKLRILNVGDYQLSFGQGLVCWSGLAISKNTESNDFIQRQQFVSRYSGVDENRFFRGVAATIKHKNIFLTTFYSDKKHDATTSYDSTGSIATHIYTLTYSGNHVSEHEIRNKNSTNITTKGANICYRNQHIETGISYVNNMLSLPLMPEPKMYNLYYFRGTQHNNTGLYYRTYFKSLSMAGEAAISSLQGKAIINILVLRPDKKAHISILHRKYNPSYYAFYGRAFGENYINRNEEGILFATEIRPIYSLQCNTYYDIFSFPWLKYSISAPSRGRDYATRISWYISENNEGYVLMKHKVKKENFSYGETKIPLLVDVSTMRLRGHTENRIHPQLLLRNRIEWVCYEKKGKENGFLAYQDIMYSLPTYHITFTLRYAMYNTYSYDSRIYAYEPDVYIDGYIPYFYYSGSRCILMCRYTTNNLSCWIRYAYLFFGQEQKEQYQALSEIKLQIIYTIR